MIETQSRKRHMGQSDIGFDRKLILLATIAQCEDGSLIITGKGRNRTATLKIESPMTYWCEKCKRLKIEADKIT